MNALEKQVDDLGGLVKTAKEAPMMKKTAAIEAAVDQMVEIHKSLAWYMTQVVESYNGLSAFIDQCAEDSATMTEINNRLKAAKLGIWGADV